MPDRPEGRFASAIEAERVRWLWGRCIPQGFITLVGGKPGGSKSLFSAFLAGEMSRQGLNVLVSASENPDSYVTRPRLEAAGADLDRVLVRRFVFPSDLEEFEKALWTHNISLACIDPLAGHIMGVSRYTESIRLVTDPLARIAERTDCAIVITEHVLKSVGPKSDPLNAIAGSGSGAPAAAQMVFIVGKDPADEDRVLLCPAKWNLRDKPNAIEFISDVVDVPNADEQALLQYVGETTFNARLLLGNQDASDDPASKLETAKEWITDYLLIQPDNKARVTDVYAAGDHDGHKKKTIKRASLELGVLVDPPGGGREATWQLPPELLDALSDQ